MAENLAAKAWSFLTNKKLVEQRDEVSWAGIKLNHKYYNYLVCGDPDLHYLKYFMAKYIKKPGRVLSLGCGNGHLERVLIGMGLPYIEMQGIDINPDLMKYAAEEAARSGCKNIRYLAADLNHFELPPRSFDLIIFFHSLHHIENLEGMISNVRNALAEDGLVLVVDFVGPSRFQWTDLQMRLTQELLDNLPDELKLGRYNPSSRSVKRTITRSTVKEVVDIDPSEAIRSGEILNLLRAEFQVLEEKPMGGTLLHLLYNGIAGNFDETNPYVCALIRSLQKTEELLILNGVISSDFIFMVLRNKPGQKLAMNSNPRKEPETL